MSGSPLIAFVVATCLAVGPMRENAAADDSKAPLADAIKRNDQAAARELLQQSVNVNAAQVDGMTALHWAAYHDDVDMTRQLIAASADVHAANRYGVRPLSIACQNGGTDIVEALLQAGADANATLRGGETVLMTAARTGKPGPVTALLAHGADVNVRERQGQTAMMWAAADGHADVVDLLIDAGADFRTPLESGFTPFFFAVREGRSDVVFRLLNAGIGVNELMQPKKRTGNGPHAGTSPLILAVENGHFELATALLKAGADPNDKSCGFTALHAMTWVRKPVRGDGDPPPIGSGRMNSLEFVRQLAAHGAEINARHTKKNAGGNRLNRAEATAFVLAAEASDVPLMELLIELGADPLLPNADNSTPLLAATGVGVLGNGDESAGTEEESIEAIRMLLALGADINTVDQNGNSALHGAAYESRTKLVQFLADHGADITVWNRKNKNGWTPLMIAQGHRPGNFRPSPETVAAIERVMRAAGVDPSAAATAGSAPAEGR